MFSLFTVMRMGYKSLAINCSPSLWFFQLFIFIMIDMRWINLAQFLESKEDCLLFLHNETSNDLKSIVSLILFEFYIPLK